MAFPTTSLIDNFNRADSGTLGANWTTPVFPSHFDLTIASNVATGSGTGAKSGYRNTSTFGPDTEAWVLVPVRGTRSMGIHGRLVNPGLSTITGYQLYITGSTWQIWRNDSSSSATKLGTDITQTVADGDSIGLEIIGTTIKAYYKSGAGAWTQKRSEVDTFYTSAGYVGLELSTSGTLTSFDNFSGGTVVTGAESHSGAAVVSGGGTEIATGTKGALVPSLIHGGGANSGLQKKNAFSSRDTP